MMITFEAELWIWDARRADSWTFVSVPADASADIRELVSGVRRGFGAVRVRVSVGGSEWRTSIFPDAARGCYVLPVKAKVRRDEGRGAGDSAAVTIEVVDF